MEDALALNATTANEVKAQVLILVLMEDALALNATTANEVKAQVLILVLMEDALALVLRVQPKLRMSLNPCSNGRCTRTCLADSAGGILDES